MCHGCGLPQVLQHMSHLREGWVQTGVLQGRAKKAGGAQESYTMHSTSPEGQAQLEADEVRTKARELADIHISGLWLLWHALPTIRTPRAAEEPRSSDCCHMLQSLLLRSHSTM